MKIKFFIIILIIGIFIIPDLNAVGTAFTCPAAKWSGQKKDFYYHVTLTHITTQDKKIVKYVHNKIESLINSTIPLTNGHRSVSWIKPGMQRNRSLFIKGEIDDFKLELHNHLMQDPKIAAYISPYIDAHVDVIGNFSKKLYKTFTFDQIVERKTP